MAKGIRVIEVQATTSLRAIPPTARLIKVEKPHDYDMSMSLCYWYECADGTIIKAHVFMDWSYEVNDQPIGTVHGEFPPHTLKRGATGMDDAMTVSYTNHKKETK